MLLYQFKTRFVFVDEMISSVEIKPIQMESSPDRGGINKVNDYLCTDFV